MISDLNKFLTIITFIFYLTLLIILFLVLNLLCLRKHFIKYFLIHTATYSNKKHLTVTKFKKQKPIYYLVLNLH